MNCLQAVGKKAALATPVSKGDGFVKVHLPFDRLTALSKAEGPFDRPFDKLTVLSEVEGLTVLSKAEGRRCVSSLVNAAY